MKLKGKYMDGIITDSIGGRIMGKYLAVFLTVFIWVLSAASVQGYEVVEVKSGATLKGAVVFKGSPPPDGTLRLNADTDYCDKEQEAGIYLISKSGVKNVVVWVEGVKEGKAVPKKSVDISIRKCRAVPHVSIGSVGGEYLFNNDDPILHTVQLKLGLAYQQKVSSRPLKDGISIYNLALPKKDLVIRKPIKMGHRYTKDTGFIQVRSNTHTWIRGYIYIFDHPYAAVTGEDGSFVIDGLPQGEYLLKVWHEGFGTREMKVKVGPGEVRELEIDLSKEEITSSIDTGASPSILFSERRFNFGTIKEGDIVRHDFEFINKGGGTLRILDLIPA